MAAIGVRSLRENSTIGTTSPEIMNRVDLLLRLVMFLYHDDP